MIGPQVVFRLSDGRRVAVPPGGLVGRGTAATLRIPDPRVSEVHALVSLRGRELRLVALRGRLEADGLPEDDVILAVGQHLELGGAATLVVDALSLPEDVLAVDLGGALRELCAESYSLVLGPAPDLVPRFVPEAAAHLWSADEGWMVRPAGGAVVPLVEGRPVAVGGLELVARRVPLAAAASSATIGPREALRLVCRTTTVHIHRGRREPVTIDARAGQLLSELALMGAPVEWAVVARELWPGEREPMRLRNNFDAVLARLRARLREHGIRDDLVRTDGRGNVEVFLGRGDEVVDEA